MPNTKNPATEDIEVSEIHSDAHHEQEHDSAFTETDTKGGTTTRERNASNKKTQVIALICGSLLILLIAAFVYFKFFLHTNTPTQQRHVPPHLNSLSGANENSPNTLGNKTAFPSAKVDLPKPGQAPVLPSSNVNANPSTPALPNSLNALPTPASSSASQPSPVLPGATPSLPTPAPTLPSPAVNAGTQPSQDEALKALSGNPVSSSSTSQALSAPASSSSSSSATASNPLASIPVNPASASTAVAPATASTVAVSSPTPIVSDTSPSSSATTPNSQAIALLNQISDQVHGIDAKVDSQNVKIESLEDRVKALENGKSISSETKTVETVVKTKSPRFHKEHVYNDNSSNNSVELAKSDNSVALVSDEPVYKRKAHVVKERVVKQETTTTTATAVQDDAPKTVTGTKVPGGECSGLSRGRVWLKSPDGSFRTLGVGDKLGENLISNVSLTDGVKAGNITYTCR